MAIDTAELLQPIPGDNACGEDVSFSDTFDRIRDARRADDASLSQGEWQTELKAADWRTAVDLASKVLRGQSKDLQAAVWLGEALIGRHGYAGAADGFDVLTGLVDTYWEGFHPLPDGDDLEERAGKLAWFNTWAGLGLKKAPLSAGSPYVSLVDWQQSRDVDNLARQNAQAYQEALAEGKPTGESFDKAVTDSGAGFVGETLTAIGTAQAAFGRLQTVVDQRFGRQAPSLNDIAEALKRAQQVVAKAAQSLGLAVAGGVPAEDAGEASNAARAPMAAGASAGQAVAAPRAASGVSGGVSLPRLDVDTQGRADLLRAIGDIAAHFRKVEPHSPVSFLLERAVQWADMPLDQWLAEVVGDDNVLGMIRDRIGVAR